MHIEQNTVNEPAFIILDVSAMYTELNDKLKRYNVCKRDIKELFWQVVAALSTHNDYITQDRLAILPDFNMLVSGKLILTDEIYERLVRTATLTMGLQLHSLVKTLGLYDTTDPYNPRFDYTLADLTNGKLVLRKFFS